MIDVRWSVPSVSTVASIRRQGVSVRLFRQRQGRGVRQSQISCTLRAPYPHLKLIRNYRPNAEVRIFHEYLLQSWHILSSVSDFHGCFILLGCDTNPSDTMSHPKWQESTNLSESRDTEKLQLGLIDSYTNRKETRSCLERLAVGQLKALELSEAIGCLSLQPSDGWRGK